jgi:zinc/manganese transport system substrate-binding protein
MNRIPCMLLAVLLPMLASPAARAADPALAPLNVVASFSILADMVSQVAGDAAEVSSLVGPNGDAHVYEPTPADARKLAQADLVFINGLRFEGWMERLARSAGTKRPVVAATRGITPRQLDGAADPHAWQSLSNARVYVENIRAALVAARPAQTAALNARAAAYLQKIDALQQRAITQFAAVPPAQRLVITTHDAFGYFGQAFHVQFIAPQKWSTEAEPSAKSVAGVIRQLTTLKVRALFVENMSDRRMMERIAQETGAVVGGSLHADALSPPGTPGDSYLGMYAHNVQSIAAALAAAVPVAATGATR